MVLWRTLTCPVLCLIVSAVRLSDWVPVRAPIPRTDINFPRIIRVKLCRLRSDFSGVCTYTWVMWPCCLLVFVCEIQKIWQPLKFGVEMLEEKKTSAPFENQKQMSRFFWGEVTPIRSPECSAFQLWGGKMKTASRPTSRWAQIKITVRKKETLLRKTGRRLRHRFTKAGWALQPVNWQLCRFAHEASEVWVEVWVAKSAQIYLQYKLGRSSWADTCICH